MMLKRFSTTLRAGALAALFVVGTSANAMAAIMVDFSTTGIFDNFASNSVTFTASPGNSVTLTFTGVNVSVNAEGGTNTSFGEMVMTTEGTGYNGGAPFVSEPFTLTVSQTVPTVGSDAFLGSVSGSIGVDNQSNFFLLFSNPLGFSIGPIQYSLQQPVPKGYALVPPETQDGETTVQGFVEAPTVVPEPATMVLLGTGLLAAFRARRKVGQQEVR